MGQSDNLSFQQSRVLLLPIALSCVVCFSGCNLSTLSASSFWNVFAGIPAAVLAAPPGPPVNLPATPTPVKSPSDSNKGIDSAANNTDNKVGANVKDVSAKNADTKTLDGKTPDEKKPDEKKPDGEQDKKAAAVVTSTPNANGFLMATEIILAGKNPFAPKLPKPQPDPNKLPDPNLVQTPGGQLPGGKNPVEKVPVIVEKPLPPPDPFSEITLNGVLYNPRTPLAIISAGGAASKIVRKGDILVGAGGPIIITSISPSTVEVATLANRKKKRSLLLPDIVGYIPRGGGGKREITPKRSPQGNDGQIIPPDNLTGLPPASGTPAGPPAGLSAPTGLPEGFPPVGRDGKSNTPSIQLKPILSGLEVP